MVYRWRFVCHATAFLDFFFSTLAVIFYVWVTWYSSNLIYEKGVLMVFIAVGAFVFALLKMAEIWTSCKLIAVTNSEDEDCRIAHEVAWRWFKVKIILMLVPILTFGSTLLVLWRCWVCVSIAGGYIVVDVLITLLGSLHVQELTTALTENEQLLAQLNP